MSSLLAIVAEPDAASLAGLDGGFEWGEAVTAAPGAVPDADVVLALGQDGILTEDGALLSRAAWPVRDDLFEAPAPAGRQLLVVTGDGDRHAGLLAKLADRGIPHGTVAAPSAADVLAAAVVAFPPSPGADGKYVPDSHGDAVPARAFAALAARRPLILPRARTTFGLLPGVDHLAASTDDEIVQYAAALLGHPDAFRIQVALGAIAAERQRASVVYGRLAAELAAR
ncbi:MAG TPA: hypothetical protein VJT75_13030 [Thermoleophilaceae bacterium]|nr:hypothetical protein [Thermoleophilaceae bacterium]